MISVIIPTYNRAELLEQTLESIHDQQFQDWECIVVDDGSTDHTREIMAKFMAKDERFQFMNNTRSKGAPGARNTGFEASHGNAIIFFDSDNLLRPDALEKMWHHLESSGADICTCFAEVKNEAHEIINTFKWKATEQMHQALLSGTSYVDNNNSLIRRTAIEAIGLTDEKCPAYQEWDTHLRISQHEFRYVTIKAFLVDYFQRSTGTISSDESRNLNGFFYVLNKHVDQFARHPEVLNDRAYELWSSAKLTNNIELIKDITDKLARLVPGFSSYCRKRKLRERARKLFRR